MSRATAGSRRGAQLSGRSGEAYHILVVDDSAMSRKMLMKCLKGEGHTCEEAEDGAQAVAMVRDKVRTHLTHLFLVLPRVRLSTVPITTHPPLAVAVGSPTPTTAS
jgi:CheY-like chemotaxis protein